MSVYEKSDFISKLRRSSRYAGSVIKGEVISFVIGNNLCLCVNEEDEIGSVVKREIHYEKRILHCWSNKGDQRNYHILIKRNH